MNARRWLVSMIGAVFGVCFAALAAGAISVVMVPPRSFRLSSVACAIVMVCLAYLSFRAATAGRTDETSFLHAMWGGVGGALIGLIVVIVAYVLFRQGARAYLAHPVGLRFSQVTLGRLLVAFLLLGFGAGFAIRARKGSEDGG